ncbi:MAG: ATP-binding protein [Thermodesulfovibrionales bacterium]
MQRVRPQTPLSSLTGKLLLTIGTLILAVSAVFWYFLIDHQEEELLRNFVRYGSSFVDSVRKSNRYGMLTFQQHLIQQGVETIGSTEGVLRIRIMNGRGAVVHSSRREEIGTVLGKNSLECLGCHKGGAGAAGVGPVWSVLKNKRGPRVLTIMQAIQNEPVCYSASCHLHSPDRKVLGIIEGDFSLAPLDASLRQQGIAIAAYVLTFTAVIAVVLCTILWCIVTTPVRMLVEGMRKVAEGDLDYKVVLNSRDEMGDLARSFNAMTAELSKAKQELVQWGTTLEKRVEEKTEAIQRAQVQLIHSEKLASLGRMAAGVAHEINNPLTGVLTFAHLLQRSLPPGSQELKDVEVIIEQSNRCSQIIKGLLGFSHAISTEKQEININELLKGSLDIVSRKADFLNIRIATRFDEALPLVRAGGLQLQQVFMNMIVNAADAMEGKGALTVSTRTAAGEEGPYAEIEFADTGCGMSEETISKIFEPFFTTKPVGKGTGLGLAVSYGIIEDHGGTIIVKSEVGRGTSFFIRLPLGG